MSINSVFQCFLVKYVFRSESGLNLKIVYLPFNTYLHCTKAHFVPSFNENNMILSTSQFKKIKKLFLRVR